MSALPLDTCLTMRAATGWNVHRTNTTVAWPRQFELLSASWVIPRKRTFEAKERDGSKCHKPAGCWPRHKRTAPVFPSLENHLQGSSLLLLSGEEAEVGTMGAGVPFIFRTPFREGSAREDQPARKQAAAGNQARGRKKGNKVPAQQNKPEAAKAGRRTHSGQRQHA